MAGVHCLVALTVLAALSGVDFGGSAAMLLASLSILVFGLPHGSLDIAVLRRNPSGSGTGLAVILALYVSVGTAMAFVWWTAPVAALAAFLAVAVVHFAEDWLDTRSPFLAIGVAVALIGAPALLHRAAVGAIFAALAGTSKAIVLADVLLVVAPVGCAVAFAGIWALIVARRYDRAAAAITSLAALIALPPALGFAVFFCLFHSPRHLGHAVRALQLPAGRHWWPFAVPALAGAAGLVAALYAWNRAAGSVSMELTSATFMALSILTVPHMAVPRLVAALDRRPATPPRPARSAPHNVR